MRLEKPDLYEAAEGGRLNLKAARCDACGELSFPLSPYGCPMCGAPRERVAEERLDGHATLLSIAVIHAKLASGLEPPVTVGEAELAPGLIEEVMLADGTGYVVGMTVEASATEIERGGETVLGCRFGPVSTR